MKFNQIKETCLYVKDLEISEKFYKATLGLVPFQKVKGRHLFYRIGPSLLLLFDPEITGKEEKLPPHAAYGQIHIALEVPFAEYGMVKEQLKANGIIIVQEQHWREDHYSFYFRDPDGHLIEVVPEGLWDGQK